MAIGTLEEKFVHDLGDIYDAEHRFLEAQEEMLQHATAPQLKKMIQTHIEQTREQIANLEQAYSELGKSPKRVKCDAAAGLVQEGQKSMKEAQANPSVLDCVIAGAAAKVEHYEVASYRGLLMASEGMKQKAISELIQRNLTQEEETAQKVESSTPALLKQAMKSAQ
jgi:ferritin-like metal-binding protein YciE